MRTGTDEEPSKRSCLNAPSHVHVVDTLAGSFFQKARPIAKIARIIAAFALPIVSRYAKLRSGYAPPSNLELQSRLIRMIDDMPIAVMTVDPQDFRINYVNKTSKALLRSIEHLLPIKADNLLGASLDIFHSHPEHQRRILSDPAKLPHNARITLGSEVIQLHISAIMGDTGAYLGPMLTWAIVTREVENERQIYQLAHNDPLTGLANRTTFNRKMETALNEPNQLVALLFLDIDGFKLVNDTRGHRIGDLLLKELARRLEATADIPSITVGRLGGDEFAVLVPNSSVDAIKQLAQRILAVLSKPYDVDPGQQIEIGVSIGIALSPVHGQSNENLLVRADLALYAAKEAGKGTFRIFSRDMERRHRERHCILSSLRKALAEQKGLFLFYQPIIDLKTKKVTAREALLRWHDPEQGWVPPELFVPLVEGSDLIDLLGAFVLARACAEAACWDDGARVAVNVSAAQLRKGNFVSTITDALAATGLAPDRLEIEVTETAMLDEEHGGIEELRRIKDIGVRVALDDFGTGYSSLTHLRRFPFDKIKIDGSFVRDAAHRAECAAIVKAIADIGKKLGVATVAEGVETEVHLSCAQEKGCSEVQGYFFGHPKPNAVDARLIAALNLRGAKSDMP